MWTGKLLNPEGKICEFKNIRIRVGGAYVRNHSYQNEFHLRENEPVVELIFHMNGFTLRLVLKQRHKGTRKLPIHLIHLGEACKLVHP